VTIIPKERVMIKADVFIRNASIRTMDQHLSHAEALAAWDGKILAVGREDDIAPLMGPDTKVLDLGGRTVLPGFIDAHEHLSWFAENRLKLDLSPDRVQNLDQLKQEVAAEAKRLEPGEWIRGFAYDDTKMADGRRLHRNDLDAAAPENPVVVIHVSGHWAVVNSRALTLGNMDRHSPDPDGGALGRDPHSGELNGLLLETAMFNFAVESLSATQTVVPPFPGDVIMAAVVEATSFLNSAGLTGVGDALTSPSYVSAYLQLARKAKLTLRVNMMIPYIFLAHLEKAGLYGGWGDPWVRAAGIKIILDGAIAGKTAALRSGYEDAPDDHGILLITDQSVLNDLVERIHQWGYHACIHANGDLAIEMALDAIEHAMTLFPRPDPRHRIEHCTMIDDRILERMAKRNVVAMPFSSYLWQHAEKLKPYYGRRAHRMFAHKSFLDAGIVAASASDHPVGLHAPLLGVQCMVTRKTPHGDVIGPEERLSLDEAFKVYTTHAAYATGEEHIKGSLTPGRLADMVVLNQDPWQTDPDQIRRIEVGMTIVNGSVVYDAG
jgi:predicted amidohydrolase YtcJ